MKPSHDPFESWGSLVKSRIHALRLMLAAGAIGLSGALMILLGGHLLGLTKAEPPCKSAVEVCMNGVDDDCNGLVDEVGCVSP